MDVIISIIIAAAAAILVPALVCMHKKYMVNLVDKRISSYQNDLMTKHIDEVHIIYTQMRGWRHDYHNHIQALKALYTLGCGAEIYDYLGKLDEDLTSVDTMLKTGNIMLDAILNSKISLAAAKKIVVNAKAAVPQKLSVSEIDLCVIIGNLLDNAIEGCLKLQNANDRFIRIYIGKHKNMLYISITNSAGGEIKKHGKTYISTKDSPSHGFGLIRIDKISAKYGGYFNQRNEEGVFATEILLPF